MKKLLLNSSILDIDGAEITKTIDGQIITETFAKACLRSLENYRILKNSDLIEIWSLMNKIKANQEVLTPVDYEDNEYKEIKKIIDRRSITERARFEEMVSSYNRID